MAALPGDGQRRALAAVLILLRERHAIFRRELRRGAPRPDFAALHESRLDGVVAEVIPVRGVAGKLVDADARDAGGRLVAAIAAEEPQLIALDRAAERAARVIRALDPRALG